MKRCPFCAEEIQEEAVYCRYCKRKVEGVRFRRRLRRAIVIAVIAALLFFAFTHRAQIRTLTHKAWMFFSKWDEFCESFEESIRHLKEGFEAMKEYRQQTQKLELLHEKLQAK